MLLVSVILAAPNAFAGFATYATDWPNDAAVVDENKKVETSSVSSSAGCAIEPVATDPAPCNIIDRVPEYKRLYVKFGVNLSSTEVRNIRSTSVGSLSGLPTRVTDVKSNGLNWEIGVGTKFNVLRFEAEYIYHKTLNYNASPVLTGNASSLVSTVKNNAVLFNLYWDFDNFVYFKPYIGALTGIVWNETRSTLTGGGVGTGAAKNNSQYALAWGATVGTRMPFWEKWYAYLGYRYTAQGNVVWKDSTTVMNLDGNYVFSGFCLGVNYVL